MNAHELYTEAIDILETASQNHKDPQFWLIHHEVWGVLSNDKVTTSMGFDAGTNVSVKFLLGFPVILTTAVERFHLEVKHV